MRSAVALVRMWSPAARRSQELERLRLEAERAEEAERSAALDKCAALLIKESGTYKITNGQFIFRAPSTADSYNAAAGAMATAAKRISDLDAEGAALKQAQLKRWKEFVGG